MSDPGASGGLFLSGICPAFVQPDGLFDLEVLQLAAGADQLLQPVLTAALPRGSVLPLRLSLIHI